MGFIGGKFDKQKFERESSLRKCCNSAAFIFLRFFLLLFVIIIISHSSPYQPGEPSKRGIDGIDWMGKI